MDDPKGRANARGFRRSFLPGIVVLVAGLTLSVLAAMGVRSAEDRDIRNGFLQLAQQRIFLIEHEVVADLEYLKSFKAFLTHSQAVSTAEFREFTAVCLQDEGGIQAMEWVPRILRSDRQAFEEEGRREGLPEFQITEINAHGTLVRASDREEYFPIRLAEPLGENRRAMGFDVASEATRLRALTNACDTGTVRASDRIRLVQETGEAYGFLAFAPVYRPGASMKTDEDRRHNLRGVVLGVFRIPVMVKEALGLTDSRESGVCLLDITDPLQPARLFPSRDGASAEDARDATADVLRAEEKLSVAGREWLIQVDAPRGYLASHRTLNAWFCLFGSATISVILAAYLNLLVGRASRSRRVAEKALEDKMLLAREINERKRAEEDLRGSYDAQELLNRLLALSLQDLSMEETLKRFLHLLLEAGPFRIESKGVIFLSDDEGKELRLVAQQGIDPGLLETCARLPFGRCLCGRAAATARPVVADHLDERHENRYHGIKEHGHYCVPILSSASRVIGVMSLYVEAGRRQKQVDADFLDAVAKVLAGLIERRRAMESLASAGQSLAESDRLLRENQLQLLQSEKMASIGQLAAGVAHEINNPVGYVTSNLTALADYVGTFKRALGNYADLESGCRLGDRARVERALSEIEDLRSEGELPYALKDVDGLLHDSAEGATRIRDIVQSLKSFARADEGRIKETDLNECVETTLKVVWNELKYKCEVHKKLHDLPLVRCNPGQINQVIMNLLVNAAQSIPEHGEVTVETGSGDGHVFVRVSDTGVGIPPASLRRIFEPFFTTKPVGKGTGLGLSVSYGIVQKHKGTIDVQSEVGKGATFTVRLPVGEMSDE